MDFDAPTLGGAVKAVLLFLYRHKMKWFEMSILLFFYFTKMNLKIDHLLEKFWSWSSYDYLYTFLIKDFTFFCCTSKCYWFYNCKQKMRLRSNETIKHSHLNVSLMTTICCSNSWQNKYVLTQNILSYVKGERFHTYFFYFR